MKCFIYYTYLQVHTIICPNFTTHHARTQGKLMSKKRVIILRIYLLKTPIKMAIKCVQKAFTQHTLFFKFKRVPKQPIKVISLFLANVKEFHHPLHSFFFSLSFYYYYYYLHLNEVCFVHKTNEPTNTEKKKGREKTNFPFVKTQSEKCRMSLLEFACTLCICVQSFFSHFFSLFFHAIQSVACIHTAYNGSLIAHKGFIQK